MISRGIVQLAVWLVLACLLPRPMWAAEPRVALVVGNAAYETAALKNPVNDARAMAAKLTELGFKVIHRENTTKLQFERAIIDFGEMLTEGAVGLFFYAGHGLQVDGRNYLVPVDARVLTSQRVRLETIDVDVVLEQMAAVQTRVSLVILDACRDNPFERRFRSSAGGLAQMNAPAGTLIAYATAPGKTAADGAGTNSIYTAELLNAVDQPGVPVEEVFKRVRVEVARNSGGRQTPWEASSLTGAFYFREPVVAAAPAPMSSAVDREALFWQTVKDSKDPADFEAYLLRYPAGDFTGLARIRLQTLQRRQAAAAILPVDPIDRPYIASATTRVRERPDTAAKQVASLNAGETVTVLGKVQGAAWYLLEREGKALGYAPVANFDDAGEVARRAANEERARQAAETEKQRQEADARRKAEEDRKRQDDAKRQEAAKLAAAEAESKRKAVETERQAQEAAARRKAEEDRKRKEVVTAVKEPQPPAAARAGGATQQATAPTAATPSPAPVRLQLNRRPKFDTVSCAGSALRLQGFGECTRGPPLRQASTGGELAGSYRYGAAGQRGKLVLDVVLSHPGSGNHITPYTYDQARAQIIQVAGEVAKATPSGPNMTDGRTTALALEIGGWKCFGFDVAGPNQGAGYRYALRGIACEEGRTTAYVMADVQAALALIEVRP